MVVALVEDDNLRNSTGNGVLRTGREELLFSTVYTNCKYGMVNL